MIITKYDHNSSRVLNVIIQSMSVIFKDHVMVKPPKIYKTFRAKSVTCTVWSQRNPLSYIQRTTVCLGLRNT